MSTTVAEPTEPSTGTATDPAAAAAVRAVELHKTYGSGDARVRALDGVDVEFATGEFTAIMGPSGSGKSTLMHCLAALDEPTAGQVYIGADELSRLSDKQRTIIRRDRIGFVFQSFNLVPTLTVLENIQLPLSIAGRRPDPDWLDLLIDVVGLGHRLDHKPSQLSGGQQQRVACARALIGRPAVIFADEPTGNLDSVSGAGILELLQRSVREFDQSVVMVTHDPAAAGHADRAVFLADGRMVDDMREPTAEKVLDRMKTFDSGAGRHRGE